MEQINRWKMNRMGFVNFWLYDEEIFDFCDGKILLRGQNGAGKSIATQSFSPFILDGDRTPRRLDPFGSSDRRMEYYFLGDGEKDDSTGYLFLEFKKEATCQYRTLVIGQRAQKGKPMSFWGFILMDGRRIGVDLDLYQQVGSEKIPFSKQDMKKVLGEEVPFTESQREYKELVNRYLFGFPRMDQYEQFIQLLVKVRAPKLSKEFKPKKVYEILNDSLQTLSDEDLRAMVDAMEKMDSIQSSLEDLRNAQKDTQIIQNEYTRYNQYVLAKKAESYLKALAGVEEEQQNLSSLEQRIESMKSNETKWKQDLENSKEQLYLNESELDNLKDLDLESAAEKKMKAEADCNRLNIALQDFDEKIELSRERTRDAELRMGDIREAREIKLKYLSEKRDELETLNEVVLFTEHDKIRSCIDSLKNDESNHIRMAMKETGRLIGEGLEHLKHQEVIETSYDAAQERVEQIHSEISYIESTLEKAQEDVEQSRDRLVEAYFTQVRTNRELKLEQDQLLSVEKLIRCYEGEREGQAVKKIIEGYRDRVRLNCLTKKNEKENDLRNLSDRLNEKRQELKNLQQLTDVEPVRRTRTEEVRRRLNMAGIDCVPFFKAVEFAEGLSLNQQNILEAQLLDAGLLDALVIAEADWQRIENEFPGLEDTFVHVKGNGGEAFEALTVSDELSEGLRQEVERILRHISISEGADEDVFLYLASDGTFRNGILSGMSCAEDSEGFVGVLARKRKREQLELELKAEIANLDERWEALQEEMGVIAERLEILENEYRAVPVFTGLSEALELVRQISWNLGQTEKKLQTAEKEAESWLQKKNQVLQKILAVCRILPYSRNIAVFSEAMSALEDYRAAWDSCGELIQQIEGLSFKENAEQERIERETEIIDDIYERRRDTSTEVKALNSQIRELNEFLNRPEIRQKAQRIISLKNEQENLREKIKNFEIELRVLDDKLHRCEDDKAKALNNLYAYIERENIHREYFDEELALKLVIQRNGRTSAECAREAMTKLRESDKNREYTDITLSLNSVFQKNSGSLTAYGASLDNWFDDGEKASDEAQRHRVVFTAVLNGKKIWLEEFHSALKTNIEETELLIQQKDRELFEDILSRTLSQQLTARIAESRRWVVSMSELMRSMDTSMGLSFALDWKAKSAENDQQIDTAELEKLLLRDLKLLTSEDMERVAAHFRSKIREEKLRAEEAEEPVNYMDLVRDALDYRKWFEFQMSYYRENDGKKILTDSAFNRFSGGEKAMAMYVPLLAAVNAQYQKANIQDHPRIVAMDEAFAGVDDKNISSMFELVGHLDFDYIMNSQSLWGCFETVPALRISEMYRPANSQTVTVIHYTWNGRERILDE